MKIGEILERLQEHNHNPNERVTPYFTVFDLVLFLKKLNPEKTLYEALHETNISFLSKLLEHEIKELLKVKK